MNDDDELIDADKILYCDECGNQLEIGQLYYEIDFKKYCEYCITQHERWVYKNG
jgi:hypothetical protein